MWSRIVNYTGLHILVNAVGAAVSAFLERAMLSRPHVWAGTNGTSADALSARRPQVWDGTDGTVADALSAGAAPPQPTAGLHRICMVRVNPTPG